MACLIPVFAQVDSLPGSQPRPPVGDREIQAVAKQAGFEVCGKVVSAFILMPVIGLASGTATKVALEILAHRRIGIFIDG